jgi:hypothetical protein
MLVDQDMKARLWEPVIMAPVGTLKTLRDTVLAISANRCPKWRFRLAPDLVVQIQPFPGNLRGRLCLFRCLVVQGEGITKEHFAAWKDRKGFTSLAFNLYAQGQQWELQGTRAYLNEATFDLKLRIIALLPQIDILRERLLFSPNCVICGKGLTDPVSRARWVGPECSHNYTLSVGLLKLAE